MQEKCRTNNGPLRTPALTRYSSEDFPRLLKSPITEKSRNKVKYLAWNFIRSSFVKNTNMPNSIKSLGYIKCYSLSNPRPAKSLAILSDTTVGRSAVDQKDLKPYWKSEKKPPFSRLSTIVLFRSFSKTLLTTERRLN